jgi:hypothetical protein
MEDFIYELPLPNTTYPNYSYETSLDGVDFKFNFRYSVRGGCWYLSIYNLSGDLLLSNCRLVPWVNLLLPYVDEDLPKGALIVEPLSQELPNSPQITFDNLVTDFKLTYLSGM